MAKRAPPNSKIQGYRKGETQPLNLDIGEIVQIAQAASLAEAMGMPSIGKTQLVNKILLEGREDAGTNTSNVNNKKAESLYKALRQLGFSTKVAQYPAAVLDKSQVAERLGITFEEAWNGTGKSADTGRTGKQHSDRAKEHESAKDDPRNKPLVDLIKRAGEGDLTELEQLVSTPYMQSGALRERYGVETPISMEDYRVGYETKKDSQSSFDDLLYRTGTAWGYKGGKPSNVSNVEISKLLEAKDRKERGEDSLTTRMYEQKMMTSPELASVIGTIAAKTGENPAPEYKAPKYSTDNESLLDKIKSFVFSSQ